MTRYYVADSTHGGSASNTGLSDASPWTAAKVMTLAGTPLYFRGGDRISFYRGATFGGLTLAVQGTPENVLTLDDYGDASNPDPLFAGAGAITPGSAVLAFDSCAPLLVKNFDVDAGSQAAIYALAVYYATAATRVASFTMKDSTLHDGGNDGMSLGAFASIVNEAEYKFDGVESYNFRGDGFSSSVITTINGIEYVDCIAHDIGAGDVTPLDATAGDGFTGHYLTTRIRLTRCIAYRCVDGMHFINYGPGPSVDIDGAKIKECSATCITLNDFQATPTQQSHRIRASVLCGQAGMTGQGLVMLGRELDTGGGGFPVGTGGVFSARIENNVFWNNSTTVPDVYASWYSSAANGRNYLVGRNNIHAGTGTKRYYINRRSRSVSLYLEANAYQTDGAAAFTLDTVGKTFAQWKAAASGASLVLDTATSFVGDPGLLGDPSSDFDNGQLVDGGACSAVGVNLSPTAVPLYGAATADAFGRDWIDSETALWDIGASAETRGAEMDLTTLARVARRIQANATSVGTDEDALLSQMITATSAAAAAYLDRVTIAASTVEYLDVEPGQMTWSLKAFPVSVLTEVAFDETQAWAASTALTATDDFADVTKDRSGLLHLKWAQIGGSNVTQKLYGALRVTYTGGMAATTAAFITAYPDISQAIEMQVVHDYNRKLDVGVGAAMDGIAPRSTVMPTFFLTEVLDVLRAHRRVDQG